MMFGVGGWGFSFFAQMVFLAELEGTVRFSMLKPGVVRVILPCLSVAPGLHVHINLLLNHL